MLPLLGLLLLLACTCGALPLHASRRTLAEEPTVLSTTTVPVESFAVGLGSPAAAAPPPGPPPSNLAHEVQVEVSDADQKQSQQLSVTVPAGAAPGTTLLVKVPGSDAQLQVLVPANVVEGQTLLVDVPLVESQSQPPRPPDKALAQEPVSAVSETLVEAAPLQAEHTKQPTAADELEMNALLLAGAEAEQHGHGKFPVKMVELHKTVILEGDEDHTPSEGDTVSVHWSGMVPSTNEIFASSRFGNGQPWKFVLGKDTVIPGLEDVLLSMHRSQRAIVDLPPVAAYDVRIEGPCAFDVDDDSCHTDQALHGMGPSPDDGSGTWNVPDETLRFELELIDIIVGDSVVEGGGDSAAAATTDSQNR